MLNGLRSLSLCLCLSALLPASAMAAGQLKSIFDQAPRPPAAAASDATPFKCTKPVRPMLDMSGLFGFYGLERTQSVIDKSKMSAYVKKVWLTQAAGKNLSALSLVALTSPQDAPSARDCIIQQLDAWAGAKAMTQNLDQNDSLGHRQANLIISWTSIPFVYAAQIADKIEPLPPETRAQLNAWLSELTSELRSEFTPRPRAPKEKWLDANGNHRFWAGASVGMMATQTGDRAAFDWSMSVLKGSLKDVDPDGSMPTEMGRGGKALNYQNFALQPMSILVSLADANGVKLSASENAVLERAARFSLSTFKDPSNLEKRIGYKQEQAMELLSWTAALARHFRASDPEFAKLLENQFRSLGPAVLSECQNTCNSYYASALGLPVDVKSLKK